ncbi:CLUMA_CG021451, isoform A [Clunio marinus]|uniref:CLUMA_CG021451, isoform A n=1 Tax=Clunio marinus TaxID=568069 RepID=A0A1J1JAR2_9DIPT|nr:CLUMA_CG021451, isoform A [Clunio marinus]
MNGSCPNFNEAIFDLQIVCLHQPSNNIEHFTSQSRHYHLTLKFLSYKSALLIDQANFTPDQSGKLFLFGTNT